MHLNWLVSLVCAAASATTAWCGDAAPDAANATPHYLLVFRALPPHQKQERNFYELTERVTGFIDKHQYPPAGVISEEGVRYGVTVAKKAVIANRTDSRIAPASEQDGTYLLVYNTLYKLCATSYRISAAKHRTDIRYTDCEDGRSYAFRTQASRAFPIYALEVEQQNVLHDIWQEQSAAR